MKSMRRSGWTVTLILGLVVSALPVSAQGILGGVTGRSTIQIAPYGGAIWFSEMGEVEAAFFPAGNDPGDLPERVTNLELRTESSPMFGLSIGWAVAPSFDLRLNGAFAVTEFDLAGVSTAPGEPLTQFESVGGLADVYVTLAGLDLLWRLAEPARTLSPYAVIGAGASIWDLNALNDFETVEPLTGVGFTTTPRTETEFLGSLGLGIDLQLGGNASLRLEAVNHISTNPVHFGDFDARPDFTGTMDAEELVNAVRMSAGVTMGLGD